MVFPADPLADKVCTCRHFVVFYEQGPSRAPDTAQHSTHHSQPALWGDRTPTTVSHTQKWSLQAQHSAREDVNSPQQPVWHRHQPALQFKHGWWSICADQRDLGLVCATVAWHEVPGDDRGSVAVPPPHLFPWLLWACCCFFPNPRLACNPWEALGHLCEQGSSSLNVLPLTSTLPSSPRPAAT